MKRYILTAMIPITLMAACSEPETTRIYTEETTEEAQEVQTGVTLEDGTYDLVYVTDVDDQIDDTYEVGVKTKGDLEAFYVNEDDLTTDTITKGNNVAVVDGEHVIVRRHDPSTMKDESFDAVVKSKERVEAR